MRLYFLRNAFFFSQTLTFVSPHKLRCNFEEMLRGGGGDLKFTKILRISFSKSLKNA